MGLEHAVNKFTTVMHGISTQTKPLINEVSNSIFIYLDCC